MVGTGLGNAPRHPSMLYEMFLEGLVLFVLLQIYTLRPRAVGAVSGLFLVGYASFRILVEFVRLPDAHIGYLAYGWVTMGQVLSLPMLLLGLGRSLWAAWRNEDWKPSAGPVGSTTYRKGVKA